jgi:hypothetical protein
MKINQYFCNISILFTYKHQCLIKNKTMKKTLLEAGDVIYLKNGMKVYADVPEKFVYANCKKSDKKTHHEVIIGKVITNDTDINEDKADLIKDIIHDFDIRLGVHVTKAEAQAMVESKVKAPKASKFCLEGGEFLVVKTKLEGGGTTMFNDVYPDGHHVFCKKLNVDGTYEDSIEVDFYQTGSFTAMIEPGKITIIRTLTPKFI